MKLVAEQVKYLRQRLAELENRMDEFQVYCKSRETAGMEGIGSPHFLDFQEQIQNQQNRKERHEVAYLLSNGDFVKDRNYDMIDIGTAFYVDFGDGSLDGRTMLVEGGTTLGSTDVNTTSTDSPFGKAILGKKAGDTITYTLQNHRQISAKVVAIDNIKENYLHFIEEKAYSDRVCKPVKRELRELKQSNPEDYKRRFALTQSQVYLLKEELGKLTDATPEGRTRMSQIRRLLENSIILGYPTGSSIQVGSTVDIMLQDGDKEPTMHHFELINRAVSTEIDADYVERVSTLGNAIYGLHAGDTFRVLRKNQPSLKGIVSTVYNYKENERVR